MTAPARFVYLLLAACAVSTAGPAIAHAQPHDKGAPSGKAEFSAGRSRFAAKDYAGALPLFRKALVASGSPNAALYVGLCQIELGQFVDAYEVMQQAERDSAKRMADDPAYAQTNSVAKEKLGLIEKKIARVNVTLAEAPAGARVSLNGKPLPPERLGTSVALAPGTASIVATAAGQPDQRTELAIAAGEEKPVTLRFGAQRAAVAPPPAVAPVPHHTHRGMSTMRIAGLAVAGVGVAGFGVFAVGGLAANSKYDDLKKTCGGHCSSSDLSSGKSLDTIANVGLVVGLVGLAGGATLFVLGGKRSEPAAALELGPREVHLRGAF